MTITIPCPICDGHGRAPLPPELADTLALFAGQRTLTAKRCHEMKPVGTRACYNGRLVQLLALGLVSREKIGRDFVYTITKAAAKRK